MSDADVGPGGSVERADPDLFAESRGEATDGVVVCGGGGGADEAGVRGCGDFDGRVEGDEDVGAEEVAVEVWRWGQWSAKDEEERACR